MFPWVFYQVFLKDTDERACAYIAGPAPNRWGFTFEGKNLLESVINVTASGKNLQYLDVYELFTFLVPLVPCTWLWLNDNVLPASNAIL